MILTVEKFTFQSCFCFEYRKATWDVCHEGSRNKRGLKISQSCSSWPERSWGQSCYTLPPTCKPVPKELLILCWGWTRYEKQRKRRWSRKIWHILASKLWKQYLLGPYFPLPIAPKPIKEAFRHDAVLCCIYYFSSLKCFVCEIKKLQVSGHLANQMDLAYRITARCMPVVSLIFEHTKCLGLCVCYSEKTMFQFSKWI